MVRIAPGLLFVRSARGSAFKDHEMGQGTHDITHLLGRVAHVGGNANNGANAGVFYLNGNNNSGNANRNIGAQLNHQNSRVSCPGPLAEYVAIKSLVPPGKSLAGWC